MHTYAYLCVSTHAHMRAFFYIFKNTHNIFTAYFFMNTHKENIHVSKANSHMLGFQLTTQLDNYRKLCTRNMQRLSWFSVLRKLAWPKIAMEFGVKGRPLCPQDSVGCLQATKLVRAISASPRPNRLGKSIVTHQSKSDNL